MLTVFIILTFLLFLLGSPIYSVLGLGSGVIALLVFGFPPAAVADLFTSSLNSFTLLALPIFVLMGDLFFVSGCKEPFMRFMGGLFGRIPGSMGIASVGACAFFAAISASSTATCVTIGLIMIPEMVRLGYKRNFASSIIAATGGIGNLIPPSLFFILYGSLEELDIATLYAAGMIPGIILAGCLVLTVYIIAKKDKIPLMPSVTWKQRGKFFIDASGALCIPIIVLGGMYGGIFTPTEAAAVGCGVMMVLGFVIYRKMNVRNLLEALTHSATTIGSIMVLVGGGIVLGKLFVLAGYPEAITKFVMATRMSPIVFLLLASLVMAILGTFIECVLMIYICSNLFYNSAVLLGIHPVFFGVLIVVGALLGMTTPPMAESIYVVSKISGEESGEIARRIVPFIFTYCTFMSFLCFFPEIALFLPRLLGLLGAQ